MLELIGLLIKSSLKVKYAERRFSSGVGRPSDILTNCRDRGSPDFIDLIHETTVELQATSSGDWIAHHVLWDIPNCQVIRHDYYNDPATAR